MLEIAAKYSNGNEFNKDIIINFRKQDSFIDYLEDVCKALEAVSAIKYKGYEIIENEHEFPNTGTLPINDSRLYLVIFKFHLTYKDKNVKQTKEETDKDINLPIYLPRLINNYYFILNGVKYYSIYQHVDSSTYNTGNCVILKSLLMPIIIKNEKKSFEAMNGTVIKGRNFILNMFKRQINIFNYFFAEFGFEDSLKYFGLDNLISIKKITKERTAKAKASEKFLYFPLGKTHYLRARTEILEDKVKKNYLITILELFKKRHEISNRDNQDYWRIKLGAFFTTNANNQLDKSKTILISLKRILDARTKKNLHIDEEDKRDIFTVIRYLTREFDTLMKLNNFSLENKRLRLAEYMITPFVKYLSNRTYRLLNSRNLSMEKIMGIFRINSMVIINDLEVSDLLRYCNAVNDCDAFNCGVKFSNRGPSAIGEGSKKTVSIFYRGIHSSHMGRLNLNACSSSDPGLSGTLSPFVKTHGMYYIEPGKIDISKSDIDN